MLEQELVQRFGPGHLVLICEEIEGVDCYRFGRVIIIPMAPLKGNDTWEVPLVVHLPHTLPNKVDKYEFKYDDNGDWDGDYHFYAIEVPNCVGKGEQKDKLDIILGLTERYSRFSIPLRVINDLIEQEGLTKSFLSHKAKGRDEVCQKSLLKCGGNETHESVTLYGLSVGEDGVVFILREDKYNGEFDEEDNELLTDVSITCDGYVYRFPTEFIEEFDSINQKWVIQTAQEPLRLLTDKEKEKLSKKSSYYGDGNELTYTNK